MTDRELLQQAADALDEHGTHYVLVCAIRARLARPEQEPVIDHQLAAHVFGCPVNCGCLWRNNHDGTVSLFDENQKSCEICESSPLNKLVPMTIADHLIIQQNDPGVWSVCASQLYTNDAKARHALHQWKMAINAITHRIKAAHEIKDKR